MSQAACPGTITVFSGMAACSDELRLLGHLRSLEAACDGTKSKGDVDLLAATRLCSMIMA